MKALRIFCGFLLMFMSCEKDINNTQTIGFEFETSFKTLTGSEIGYFEENELKLGVSDETIMKTFKEFVVESGLNLEPESFEIIEVDGQNYLRFYSKGHRASTIALFKGNQNKVITGKTTCTSSACNECCGCLPNGDYCTACERYSHPYESNNDCLRSTSS